MQEWHQFLKDSSSDNTTSSNHSGDNQNVVIENNIVVSFDNPAIERQALINQTVICDLSHLGLLQLQGADALTFLQGQVTNDIKLLDGRNAHYTAYCNPKGRMLGLFLAFSHDDHLHLQMPKELVESIAKRLKMYVMRSKVVITDASESIIKIGLNGSNATELLKPLFSQIPQNDYELVSLENGALLKLPGSTPRYEIFTDSINAPAIWNALKVNAKPVGAACWEWLEIQAGIPEIMLKTQEEFVPQMLNLDALNAINYKKGCYTGQEIVARTHYLGKIKRRTQLAHIASATMPVLGDDVTDAENQAIGKIVRCAPAIDAGFDVLVECRLEHVKENGVFWNGIALTIEPLPYPLDESA
ncbi:MAG TPA: folate-binding protein [Methylotenera sp.]|nr:folate-binding protein [Methylotenera sp.]